LKRISSSENEWTASPATQFARIQVGELDELAGTEKASGQYRTIYVRQNHIIPQQQSRGLSNLKLFRIRHKRDVRPGSGYPPGQWDPQTELFSSTVKNGKAGGLLFTFLGLRYIVILGLSDLGTPWTHILPNPSPNPDQDWTSYRTTGREVPKSGAILQNHPRLIAGADVKTAEVYGTPVFIVEILHGAG
jgi:hypothetical protein